MKTFKKVLCVILSVIMAMSSLSAIAFANDDNTAEFTDSFRYYTDRKDAYGTDKLLDLIDKLLAEKVNFKEVVDLKVTTITIDLTSVNGLCDTLDLIKSVWDLADSETIVGDLADLNFDVWKSGMSRGSQDATIIKELLEFLGTTTKKSSLLGGTASKTNAQVIAGLLDGDAKLGLLDEFVDINELLGADGASGLIKELILGNDYEAYKNDVDGFIYKKINDLAAQHLPGFTIDSTSTINSLICLLFGVVINQYALPALKGINVDLAANSNEIIKKLDGKINLKGSTYNFEAINFDPAKPFLDQINNEIGKIFTQVVPGYTWQSGDYTMIGTNIEDAFQYLGAQTGIIENAEDKELEEIVEEVIRIVLNNVDTGAYGVGITECNTIEDMLKVLLINTANELQLGTTYTNEDTYLVVLGDILGYYAYSIIDLEDANGNDYQIGDGDDVFTVINYIANYFLIDKGIANLLDLNTSKTDTIFVKIDKLADYFGETKSKGIAFDSEKFILGKGTSKGILDSVFTLDIENIIEITAVPALEKAGDVPVEKFLYNTVRYCLNNWSGSKMLPEYKAKAFTNALSNSNIGNIIVGLLTALNKRSASIVTLLATVMSVASSDKVVSAVYGVMDYVKNDSQEALDKVKEQLGALAVVVDWIKGFIEDNAGKMDEVKAYIDVIAETDPNTYTITQATAADFEYTGSRATPVVTVKADGKALTQGKDYIVKTDASQIGAATARVEGVGLYSGSFEVPFNIIFGKVEKASVARTADSLTLKWDAVAGADGYNVYMLENGEYVLKAAGAETTYKATALQPGTNYSFRIEAVSTAHGVSQAKEIAGFTKPAKVDAATVKYTSTDTTVTLTWAKAQGATGYRIDRYVGGKWEKVATSTKNSVTVKGLKASTNHYFRIWSYARDINKALVYGDVSSKALAKTKVSTVTGLAATATSSSIKLTWNKASDAAGYQVYQYKGGKWVRLGNTTGTSYTVSKLTANTKYYFKVRAYKKVAGSYQYGEYASVTPYTALPKVAGLKIKKATTSAITLTWTKVTGAAGYQVYQYKGGKWVRLGNATTNSYTVSKLSAGTSYKFYVRAFKKNGSTYNYGEKSSTLTAKTALGQTTGLKAASRKRTSITLSWSKVTGATGYQIYQYKGGKWVKVGTVKTTKFTSSSLTRNTQYQYKVRAYGTVNGKTAYGAYSSTLKAKTTLL